MNTHQIAFILSINNIQEAEECLRYINRLKVPEGYEIDILTIREAASMAEAYDVGMKSSEAKYKIYLHQDVFLIYPELLTDMIEIFQSDESIGLMGCIGNSNIPENALAGSSWDTGKLLQNQVPKKEEYSWVSEKLYREVEAVDGLFIATQYDVDWRKDIFDGWDFYDISQCFEMKRKGYKVVVPFQNEFWCYHDHLYSKMLDYDRCRVKFIREYQDMKNFKLEEDYDLEKCLSYERMKIELMKQMEELINTGEMHQLIEVFQNPQNKGYLFFREYEVLSCIYQREQLSKETLSVWKQGSSFKEAQELLHQLKFWIKAIEYDSEERDTIEQIKTHYSKSAVECMIEEYCVWKDKVRKQIYDEI